MCPRGLSEIWRLKEDMSRNHAPLNARRWAAVRHEVFKRDSYRCTSCGKSGRLECDHVTPLQREPGQDPYDPNGLQTLCKSCHIAKTREENFNPDRLQWADYVNDIIARHGDGPE